jgi:hypothetical protein
VSPNLGLGFDTSLTHPSGLGVSLDHELRRQLQSIALDSLAREIYSKAYNQCTAVERASVVLMWIRIEDQLTNQHLTAEPKPNNCIFC